jgi:hypothetical protein
MTQGVVPQADPPADTDVRQGVGDPPGCVSWDLQRDGAFDAWRKRINRSQTPKGGDESQRKLKSLLSTRINTPPNSATPCLQLRPAAMIRHCISGASLAINPASSDSAVTDHTLSTRPRLGTATRRTAELRKRRRETDQHQAARGFTTTSPGDQHVQSR